MQAELGNEHVIAPDVGSGKAFFLNLQQTISDRSLGISFAEIAPRVVGGELTKESEKVAQDLARAIDYAVESGAKKVTIACNTLSLPIFVDQALEFVKARPLPEMVLTIQEIAGYLAENPDKNIVILGTKPLSKILAQETTQHYPTLANSEGATDSDLDLVQEIIWRVKADQGSDVSSAPKFNEPFNKDVLLDKLKQLNERLIALGIQEVIMGCTELPDAFQLLKENMNEALPYNLIDPAKLVGLALKRQMSEPKRV